jgi:stearoyl-CoA desaturase (delta-9 desaturase)
MHVFARYTQEVLAPVTKAELCSNVRQCRREVRRAQRILAREGHRLDAAARVQLDSMLSQSQTLATVYQFRERLQGIWELNTPSQDDLLRALQEWCRQAEATGIAALQRFAENLKGFSLQAAPVGRAPV